MIFLLDTSAFSELMRTEPGVSRWLASMSVKDSVVVCPIVRGEIQFGISKLSQGKRRAALESFATSPATPLAAVPPLAPWPASDPWPALLSAVGSEIADLGLGEGDEELLATVAARLAELR